jgi:aspartate/methionine/tyrosine aminotransferase
MQYAVAPALTGDRSHQATFTQALKERAEITAAHISTIPGMKCVQPRAAFYAMPQVTLPRGKTDADFVLGLLRATGILCVYGSGFGTAPEAGFFRIVFLASPNDLHRIYDDMAGFTAEFLK